MTENEIGKIVIDSAMTVQCDTLGPVCWTIKQFITGAVNDLAD
jgi:hypothetical protein